MSKQVGSQTSFFLYADHGLIGEYNANGIFNIGYGWLPDGTWGTAPVLMVQNGEYNFYHNDNTGTPQKTTDVNGNVVWSATYGPFGETAVGPASKLNNNLRFPGQYFDEETNLHYNWHRYFSPETGRYMQVDPIRFVAGDENLYRYISNNPLNSLDPLGLWEVEVGGVKFPLINNFLQPSDKRLSEAEIALALAPIGSVGKFAGRASQKLTHDVYIAYKNGKAVYVGISKDVKKRACQHGERFDTVKKVTPKKVTNDQARAIEQTLKEKNPHFQNINNSIAKKRSWYQEAVEWGKQWLTEHGM